MAPQDQALDELVWRNSELAIQFGGIHENTVLFYFAKSPFFDPTSNNATVETQAMFNQEMLSVLETRESFEKHLENLSGIEYRVHLGPKDFGPEAAIGRGLWVIRKQNRRIIYGQGDAGPVDAQITVLATYFVIGEIIYMARSVKNILGSRLLSTVSALSKVSKLASSLSLFTPAFGYHYIPLHLKPKKSTTSSSQPIQLSREATPTQDTASQLSLPLPKPNNTNADTSKSTKAADLGALLDAYQQFNSFGNEYMDENPLLGEPGSFQLSNSTQHVQAQKEAAAKRAQQQAELKRAQEEARKASVKAEETRPAPAPLKVKKESVLGKRPAGKDGKPKVKRRKTKGTPMTPRTPMVETPGAVDSTAPSTPAASPS